MLSNWVCVVSHLYEHRNSHVLIFIQPVACCIFVVQAPIRMPGSVSPTQSSVHRNNPISIFFQTPSFLSAVAYYWMYWRLLLFVGHKNFAYRRNYNHNDWCCCSAAAAGAAASLSHAIRIIFWASPQFLCYAVCVLLKVQHKRISNRR